MNESISENEHHLQKQMEMGTSRSSPVVRNPPANAGDMGLIPGLGRSYDTEPLSPCVTTTEPVL